MPNVVVNKKVTELPVATTVDSTDVLLVVQGGITKQVSQDTVAAAVAVSTQLTATYLPLALQADGLTYNPDGSVATSTLGGITTAYTYDSNGNVATETRLGKTKTWSYDGSGNPTGSVIA